jgi:hypothetical protein
MGRPRGRPIGTKYPTGIANVIWLAVELERGGKPRWVNKASIAVAKVIAKKVIGWRMSRERIRHLHCEVENRRERDPHFAACCDAWLEETRAIYVPLRRRGLVPVLVPLKMRGLYGDRYAYAILYDLYGPKKINSSSRII